MGVTGPVLRGATKGVDDGGGTEKRGAVGSGVLTSHPNPINNRHYLSRVSESSARQSMHSYQESDYLEALAERVDLTLKQCQALTAHLSGDISLLRISAAETMQTIKVNRIELLRTFVIKLLAFGYELSGLYLNGSSVETILNLDVPKSDYDLTLHVVNLPRQFDPATAQQLSGLMAESLSNFIPQASGEIFRCFGSNSFYNEHYRAQIYFFKLGRHDTDLVLFSHRPDYALAHQGRAIDILPLLLGGVGGEGGGEDGGNEFMVDATRIRPKIVFLEEADRVQSALQQRWIVPNADSFYHWSHIIPVAKALSKGFTHYDGKTATQFYRATLAAMKSQLEHTNDGSEEKANYFSNRANIAWMLREKMGHLTVQQTVCLILDLPKRVDTTRTDRNHALNHFYNALRGHLHNCQFYLQKQQPVRSDEVSVHTLVAYLASQTLETLQASAEAISFALALKGFLSSSASDIRLQVEHRSDRHFIATECRGVRVNTVFDSEYLPVTNDYSDLLPAALLDISPAAACLITDWEPQRVERVYEVAQLFKFNRVVKFIDIYRSVEHDRADGSVCGTSSSVGTPELTSSMVESLMLEGEESDYQPASYLTEDRWIVGNKLYKLTGEEGEITLGDDHLPKSPVTIRSKGRAVTLLNLKRSNDQIVGEARVDFNAFGRSGLISFDLTIDAKGGLAFGIGNAKIDMGELHYEGPVRATYGRRGRSPHYLPCGEGTLTWIRDSAGGKKRGKRLQRSVQFRGQFSLSGQMSLKDVNGKSVGSNAFYIDWSQISKVSEEQRLLQFSGFKEIYAVNGGEGASDQANRKGLLFEGQFGLRSLTDSKGEKNKVEKGEDYFIPIEGKLYLEDEPSKCLLYATDTELGVEHVVLTDLLDNGVITYQIADGDGRHVSGGAKSGTEAILKLRMELGGGYSLDAKSPPVFSKGTQWMNIARTHLEGEKLTNVFNTLLFPMWGREAAALTRSELVVDYAFGHLDILFGRLALPLTHLKGQGGRVSSGVDSIKQIANQVSLRNSAQKGDLLYERSLSSHQALEKQKKKNSLKLKQRLNLQAAKRKGPITQQKAQQIWINSGDEKRDLCQVQLVGGKMSEYFAHTEKVVVVEYSLGGAKQITLPVQVPGDAEGYHYLLRFAGDIEHDLTLGKSVSKLIISAATGSVGVSDVSWRLHRALYTPSDRVGGDGFVQVVLGLADGGGIGEKSAEDGLSRVKNVEILSNELAASWREPSSCTMQVYDSLVRNLNPVFGDDGTFLCFEKQLPRDYPALIFKKAARYEGNEAWDVAQHSLLLSNDFTIELEDNSSDLPALTFQREATSIGDRLIVKGELPECDEAEPFTVKGLLLPSQSGLSTILISARQGDKVFNLKASPGWPKLEGVETLVGLESDERELLDLVDTAIRAATIYIDRFEPRAPLVSEALKIDLEQIEVP